MLYEYYIIYTVVLVCSKIVKNNILVCWYAPIMHSFYFTLLYYWDLLKYIHTRSKCILQVKLKLKTK